MLENEQDILEFFYKNKEMMAILKAVETLNLPDWWICAGYIRSQIWDILHGFQEPTPVDDVDVVYFDPFYTNEAKEKELEQRLYSILPTIPWSVKNQARMHQINGLDPYENTVDAISKFPETVTSIGIKLNADGSLQLTAPHGIEDMLNMTVRPTPYFAESNEKMQIYQHRLKMKKWHEKWRSITYIVE